MEQQRINELIRRLRALDGAGGSYAEDLRREIKAKLGAYTEAWKDR